MNSVIQDGYSGSFCGYTEQIGTIIEYGFVN